MGGVGGGTLTLVPSSKPGLGKVWSAEDCTCQQSPRDLHSPLFLEARAVAVNTVDVWWIAENAHPLGTGLTALLLSLDKSSGLP